MVLAQALLWTRLNPFDTRRIRTENCFNNGFRFRARLENVPENRTDPLQSTFVWEEEPAHDDGS
jgi:hypothetical protein